MKKQHGDSLLSKNRTLRRHDVSTDGRLSGFDNTIEQAKKPVQSDYENGVITLPLIHTFQQDAKLKLQADQENTRKKLINQ